MQPVRENLLLRNNKFILKRGLQALRPQFDPEHPRRARGICHCAKINYPKPILGKNVAQQSDFVVPERQSPAFIITNQSAKPAARQGEFVVT